MTSAKNSMQRSHRKRLTAIVREFPGKRIGVVGDVMLDIFTYGKSERMSPEAPVPVILVEREASMPGGAANVAHNIAALGAHTDLVGRVGLDTSGKCLREISGKAGVTMDGVFSMAAPFQTIEKRRILSSGSQIVRVDRETREALTDDDAEKFLHYVHGQAKQWNGIVIIDYGKGFVTKKIVEALSLCANEHTIPLIVDTKPSNAHLYSRVSLITPNQKEAFEISGEKNLELAGRKLNEQFQSPVLVTQGELGMTLYNNTDSFHLPAQSRKPVDVSGAGDTVAAVTILALSCGANLTEAIELANIAAGISVEKPGTAVVETPALIEAINADVV